MIFEKLGKCFLRRILHKNLQIHWGRVEIDKKYQSTFTDLSFFARNSQDFEKDYKITVVDKTILSNILKIQIIIYRNEGVSVFKKKFTMKGTTR